MTSTVRVVRENREFKFDFEYRYQQQVMFMHCGRKKHEGKRRHVAKHLKLGGVGGLYLKFELQLKSNKIFIRFPDSPFPVLKIAAMVVSLLQVPVVEKTKGVKDYSL
jgi:hypothetical protein